MSSTSSFSVEILHPGEDIVYRENGREYHFNICLVQHPLILYADQYWDGLRPMTKKRLTDEERARILTRIVDRMSSKGEPVEIRDTVEVKRDFNFFFRKPTR